MLRRIVASLLLLWRFRFDVLTLLSHACHVSKNPLFLPPLFLGTVRIIAVSISYGYSLQCLWFANALFGFSLLLNFSWKCLVWVFVQSQLTHNCCLCNQPAQKRRVQRNEWRCCWNSTENRQKAVMSNLRVVRSLCVARRLCSLLFLVCISLLNGNIH